MKVSVWGIVFGLCAMILASNPTLAKVVTDNRDGLFANSSQSNIEQAALKVPVDALGDEVTIRALGKTTSTSLTVGLIQVAELIGADRRKALERHYANRHERRAKRRAKRAERRALREARRKARRNKSTKVAIVEPKKTKKVTVKKRVVAKKRIRKKVVKKKVVKTPEIYKRAEVAYVSAEPPGTIIVETSTRHLYRILDDKTAVRYGVAVGREGFAWSGEATVERKVEWPTWTPPKEMIARSPKLKKWAKGQPGGPTNPLGAAALYLFQGEKDTLYRIHGTNAPSSIGKAACTR